MLPSTRGLSHRPFTAESPVRIRLGVPYKADTAKYNVKHLIVKIWLSTYICLEYAKIAQLAEHRTHIPNVTGSIPVLGTSSVGYDIYTE